MAIYFLDSSALVKRYINETGSAWMLGLFTPTLSNDFFVAAITGVEIVAAITRRTRNGSVSATDAALVCDQLRSDLQTDYQVIEITEEHHLCRFFVLRFSTAMLLHWIGN